MEGKTVKLNYVTELVKAWQWAHTASSCGNHWLKVIFHFTRDKKNNNNKTTSASVDNRFCFSTNVGMENMAAVELWGWCHLRITVVLLFIVALTELVVCLFTGLIIRLITVTDIMQRPVFDYIWLLLTRYQSLANCSHIKSDCWQLY